MFRTGIQRKAGKTRKRFATLFRTLYPGRGLSRYCALDFQACTADKLRAAARDWAGGTEQVGRVGQVGQLGRRLLYIITFSTRLISIGPQILLLLQILSKIPSPRSPDLHGQYLTDLLVYTSTTLRG